MEPLPRPSPWHPANALAYLGLALARALGRQPLARAQALGTKLGSLAGRLAPVRASVGHANLKACFPALSDAQRTTLLRQHYAAMGTGIAELAQAWYANDEALAASYTIEGLDVIDHLRRSGRGALIFTGHFTTIEIIGRFMLRHFGYSCFYRAPNQPVFAAEMKRLRLAAMKHVLEVDEINTLVKALRGGEWIWYTPDQGRAIKQSLLSPFFGVPAVTNAITGRLAKMGNAAVIPFFGHRQPDGHYHIQIHPPLAHFPTAAPQAVADETNAWIERFVRQAPEQYFWLHRRFKRRGHGLPNLYGNA